MQSYELSISISFENVEASLKVSKFDHHTPFRQIWAKPSTISDCRIQHYCIPDSSLHRWYFILNIFSCLCDIIACIGCWRLRCCFYHLNLVIEQSTSKFWVWFGFIIGENRVHWRALTRFSLDEHIAPPILACLDQNSRLILIASCSDGYLFSSVLKHEDNPWVIRDSLQIVAYVLSSLVEFSDIELSLRCCDRIGEPV